MAIDPPTEQGRATRDRIVTVAAQLIGERGVAATSLDDVMTATQASKSQLYHYFGDKHGLVEAVVEYQSAAVLDFQAQALASVHNWEDLEGWADAMVAMVEAARLTRRVPDRHPRRRGRRHRRDAPRTAERRISGMARRDQRRAGKAPRQPAPRARSRH